MNDISNQRKKLQQAFEETKAFCYAHPELGRFAGKSVERKDIIAFSFRKKWKIYFGFFQKDE